MKIDGFLKVPDIPGASTRDGHEEEIEIHGVEFSMVAPHDPNSLSRRGRVALGAMKFIKNYDKASPLLKMALFTNKKLDEVVFSARRTIEGETNDYLVITMRNASVIHYDMKVNPEDPDLIEDTIGFAYEEIEFEYDGKDPQTMNVHVGK